MGDREFVTDYKWTYECPVCGHIRVPCDFAGCREEALYTGWHGSGLIKRVNACETHIKELRGYKENDKVDS